MTKPIARIGDLYDDGDEQMEGSGSVFANFTPVARVGDLTTGHSIPPCFWPPVGIITGSSTVFANFIPIAGVGDIHDVHCCGPICHTGEIIIGSDNVMVGG